MSSEKPQKELATKNIAVTPSTFALIQSLKQTERFAFAPTSFIIKTALLHLIKTYHIHLNGRVNENTDASIENTDDTNINL